MTSDPKPKIALLPDTLDSRLLVDLTSHATDLSEASHTLTLALDAGEDSELWSPLTMHAVTAYIRPFIHSNVRERLDRMSQFPGIPTQLIPVHETIRTYRNTTVAHSQSDLAMPVALASLDEQGAVLRVMGVTLLHPMPLVLAERTAELVQTIGAIVETMTRPVTAKLHEQLRGVSPEVVAGWKNPEMFAKLDTDFTGTGSRTKAPRFTSYWRVDRPKS